MALLDTPLIFYTFRLAVTSVAPLMVLNLPEEGRRIAANFVAPLIPASSPQAVCF